MAASSSAARVRTRLSFCGGSLGGLWGLRSVRLSPRRVGGRRASVVVGAGAPLRGLQLLLDVRVVELAAGSLLVLVVLVLVLEVVPLEVVLVVLVLEVVLVVVGPARGLLPLQRPHQPDHAEHE